MTSPIIVAGGGIAGLTVALSLLRQGRQVIVLEQTRAIGDVGAGISLGARTSRALYALGIEAALKAVSDTPQGSAAFDYRTGEVLGGAYARRNWSAADMADVNMLHRADLFDVLKAAIDAIDPQAVRLGHRLERYEQDEAGVTVHLSDGDILSGSVLIGADGLRSTVRSQMTGEVTPRATGRVAYRFLVPMAQAAPFMGAGPAGIYVGSRVALGRYVIRKGTLVNCVAFAHRPDVSSESWSQRATRDELMALFDGWHPDVRGLASAAPLERTARWALYDRDPLDTWIDGRVTLIGDAAHPLIPFLGLGAAMGVEDAIIMARAFAQWPEPAQALDVYQRARTGRANAILLESRRQAEVFDAGPGATNDMPDAERESRVDYDPLTVALPQPWQTCPDKQP
ncbi:FAD-dependent oxidoreductase [Novosphingobium guangzhouense]|nr:FAD-dependent oxidoreductase [Novosphingobium guangzhouense]